MNLSRFEVSPLYSFQTNSTGNAISAMISWVPEFRINSLFSASLEVGVSLLPGKSDFSKFLLIEELLFLNYRGIEIHPIGLGFGVGAQTWLGFRTHIAVGARAEYRLQKPIFWKIDRISVHYNALLIPRALTFFLRLGLGFSLDRSNGQL